MDEGPVWVAEIDEAIVATASAVETAKGLYVRGMGAIPESRGGRLGWLLLEHAEAFARAKAHGRIYLSTTPFLTRATRLYEHYGFKPASDGPSDLFGTPLFAMVKTLTGGST